MSDNSEDRSPEDMQQAWKDFKAQHGDGYLQTLKDHHEATIYAATLEPGTHEVKLGSSVIRISAKPRHPRYGEPAPESLSARRDPATLEAITTGIEKKSPDSMEAYMRASKAWYADYDEWQEAQKRPAYVVHTPWKCPSPPPLPADQGTFVGSIANGFHIEARDETGPTSIYLTNLDVPSEALSYLEYFLTQWQSVDPNTFEDKILYATQSLNEIRPQTADQQRADHEFLGQILKGLLEAARNNPPQTPGAGTKALPSPQGHGNAQPLPFLNHPAMGVTAELISNYQDRERFTVLPDHKLAQYTTKMGWAAHNAVLDLTREIDALHLEGHEAITTYIWSRIEEFSNVSRDGIDIATYALAKLIDSEQGFTDLFFLELLDLQSKRSYGAEAREIESKKYDAVLKMAGLWAPWGKRRIRDPLTKKWIEIEQRTPILGFVREFYLNGQRPLEGMYKTPHGWSIGSSPLSAELRNNPLLKNELGELKNIAEIPSRQPGGDWAKSIGYTAVQSIRKDSKYGGHSKKLKRRTLLETHPPVTSSLSKILDSRNPGRALDYWEEAIQILKEKGVFAEVKEPPRPTGRKEWKKTWPEETVEITLAGTWADAPKKVRARNQTALAQAKKRKTQKK